MQNKTFDLIIMGGGLAGLTTALHLATHKLKICLIEKQKYPHHKVCGEYVSNEVLPYLRSLGIDPINRGAHQIDTFRISNKKGKTITAHLEMGGFGMSRFALDNLLYEKIKDTVTVIFDAVTEIDSNSTIKSVTTQNGSILTSPCLVGAFGKRSNIDKILNREFISKKSPWLAVKSHYTADFQSNVVELHNFEGGYCGLSKIETGSVNVSYLTSYASFKRYGNIEKFEKQILCKNPHLHSFFKGANPIFDSPLVISQISFQEKNPVDNHIFMVGDSAGLIHPLCGNGMAMAIHSAKLFSDSYLNIIKTPDAKFERLEKEYSRRWNETFKRRLMAGRVIQKILLSPILSNLAYSMINILPFLLPKIITLTHGKKLKNDRI